MADLNRDQYVGLILDAMKQVESGGRYDAEAPDGGYGAYQFQPDTWAKRSKKFTESVGLGPRILPIKSDKNQDALARDYVEELIDSGHHDVREIASIWNSGSPKWEGKRGINKAGVKYDVPAHVEKVWRQFTKLLSSMGPSEAQASEAPQPTMNYAAELLGVQPSQEVKAAAEAQPNVAGVPSMDYAKELLEKQPLKPTQPPQQPGIMPSGPPVSGQMPERPIVENTGMWPLIQASMVNDPATRIKILAKARGIPPENYFVKDGQTYYVKDGKAVPEISDSAFSQAKEFLAGVIGNTPAEAVAITGGAVGGVPGVAAGAMVGKEVQNQIARIFFGEPQTILGNMAEDVTEGVGALAGLGIGKAIGAAGDAILRKGAGTGVVGKLAQRDLPLIDKTAMNQRLKDAADFGVDITTAEATKSPTLKGALQSVQTKPGIPKERFGQWVEGTRIPQVESAMEREISRISPVSDVADAGQVGVAAAKGAMQGLITERRTAAKPFYDAVAGQKADVSNVIQSLDDLISTTAEASPVRSQLSRFKRMLLKTETDAQGNQIQVPQDDIRVLDGVKKQIDKMLKGDIWAKSADKETEYKLKTALTEMVDTLKQSSPEYQAALTAFAEKSEPINTFRFGVQQLPPDRKIPKSLLGTIEDLEGEAIGDASAKLFGKQSSRSKVALFRRFVTPHDPEALPALVAGHFRNALENLREGNPATIGARFKHAVFETPRQRDMIKEALTDQPGAFARWERFMSLLDETDKIIYSNSQTTPLAQVDRMIQSEAGGLPGKIAGAAGTTLAPSTWQRMIENLRYPQYAQAMYEMIMDPASTSKINRLHRIPDKAKKAIEVTSMLSGIIGADALIDTAKGGGDVAIGEAR